MENFQVYRDIQARTGGDIYIGVVGPVRTGKSTFIRRFMEVVALPQMSENRQAEIRDQLPLSGSGKIITTVETKFIPKEAIPITLGEDQKVKIRSSAVIAICSSSSCFCPSPQNDGAFYGGPSHGSNFLGGSEFRLRQGFAPQNAWCGAKAAEEGKLSGFIPPPAL